MSSRNQGPEDQGRGEVTAKKWHVIIGEDPGLVPLPSLVSDALDSGEPCISYVPQVSSWYLYCPAKDAPDAAGYQVALNPKSGDGGGNDVTTTVDVFAAASTVSAITEDNPPPQQQPSLLFPVLPPDFPTKYYDAYLYRQKMIVTTSSPEVRQFDIARDPNGYWRCRGLSRE